MKRSEFTEVDVARPVVEWLQGWNWDVYQEVKTGYSGRIADIVAVRDGVVWVIEVKTSLSLAVMEQADNWRWRAHYVSVATLGKRIRKGRDAWKKKELPDGRKFAERVLKDRGIGLFELHERVDWDMEEREIRKILVMEQVLEPSLMRKAKVEYLTCCLNEAQKTMCEAGSRGGRRWSPFQQTVMDIRKFVESHPQKSCLLRTAVEHVKHHYHSDKSAISSLSHWIAVGKIPGFRIEKQGRHNVLVLEEGEGEGDGKGTV